MKKMEVEQLQTCLKEEQHASGAKKRKVKFDEKLDLTLSTTSAHDLSNPECKKRASFSMNPLCDCESYQRECTPKGHEKKCSRHESSDEAELPWVVTTANEKIIRGKLSSFEKRNDVKIVCLCHMTKMSPREFVKHAGCTDLTDPEKNIIVIPPGKYRTLVNKFGA